MTAIFLFGDKGCIDEQFARPFLMLYKPFLCQDLQEGGDGGVGRLGLWIMRQDIVDACPFLQFPQDIHHLHLTFGQCLLLHTNLSLMLDCRKITKFLKI